MGEPTEPTVTWPGDAELKALGRVIQAASGFEEALRNAFCALVGSKYAAVIAGREQGKLLIDKCKDLVKAQHEIREDQKRRLLELLSECTTANDARNRLVHDLWAFGSGGATLQFRRERAGYDLTSRPITLDEIASVENALTSSSAQLSFALMDIFGPERATLEAQLRWEDHIASMTPDEQRALVLRRLAG